MRLWILQERPNWGLLNICYYHKYKLFPAVHVLHNRSSIIRVKRRSSGNQGQHKKVTTLSLKPPYTPSGVRGLLFPSQTELPILINIFGRRYSLRCWPRRETTNCYFAQLKHILSFWNDHIITAWNRKAYLARRSSTSLRISCSRTT